MSNFKLNKEIARLILLQRIELANPTTKKLRKLLGRSFFTNFISKYLIDPNEIGLKYLKLMEEEFKSINKYFNNNDKNFLSIGGGMGGLELIINRNFEHKNFHFIEKNYISKKIKYGWDKNNNEAYNNLELLSNFLSINGMDMSYVKIYDTDKNNLPSNEYDIIISLFSLDYHYEFNIYYEYLKKNSNKNTKIIFDTIRADFFSQIFQKVEVIKSYDNTVHKSKRVICSNFK